MKVRSLARKLRDLAGKREEGLPRASGDEKLTVARQQIRKKNQRLKRLQRRLKKNQRELERLRTQSDGDSGAAQSDGVKPENLIWIFGTGRTGSSWLAAMMGAMQGYGVWFEPRVGRLLDPEELGRVPGKNYVFSAQFKEIWLNNIRQLVLDGASARFPQGVETVVIKEPGGSAGAPLLMEALPESRMVLLVRDPRDVVASWLEATGEGGWSAKRGKQRSGDVDTFVRSRAETYLKHLSASREAYESHAGGKVLVRYEDLRTDPLGTLERLYSGLGMPVAKEELARVVEKHSWDNIPKEKKGEGKFYRKASPGSWREDLTVEQAEDVERITAPLLKLFYAEEQ
jgi:hypothetical protein